MEPKKRTRLVDIYNAYVAEPVTGFATGLAETSLRVANFLDPKRKKIRGLMLSEIEKYREAQQQEAVNRLGRGRSKYAEYPAWWLREAAQTAGKLLPSYVAAQGVGAGMVGLANRSAVMKGGALTKRTYHKLKDLPHVPKSTIPLLTYGDEVAVAGMEAAGGIRRKNSQKNQYEPYEPYEP